MAIRITIPTAESVDDQRFPIGSLHILNTQGDLGLFEKYDPAETTITLAKGMPVGLKNASEVLVTADLTGSKANKCKGVAMAVPTPAKPFFFVLCRGFISNFGLTLVTDGAVDDGEAIIWGADLTVDPKVALTEIAIGVAGAADGTGTSLASAFINTIYST